MENESKEKEIELFEEWLDEYNEESEREKVLSYRVVAFYDNRMVSDDYENSISKFIELGKMNFNRKVEEIMSYREENRYRFTDFFYENFTLIMLNLCKESPYKESEETIVGKSCLWNRTRLHQTLIDLKRSAENVSMDDIMNPRNKHTDFSFTWIKKDMRIIASVIMAIAITNAYEKFKLETSNKK